MFQRHFGTLLSHGPEFLQEDTITNWEVFSDFDGGAAYLVQSVEDGNTNSNTNSFVRKSAIH